MTAFHYTKEFSVSADDLAETMVDFMYDDGDAFADLINKIAAALIENEFDGKDAHEYAKRLDGPGRELIRALYSTLPEKFHGQ